MNATTISTFSRVASSSACRRLNRSVLCTFSSSTSASPHDDDNTATNTQQQKRRTRRRQLPNDGKESIPSLADFMHRAKVRKQYRNFVRLAHFVDNTSSSAGNEGKAATGECRAALEEVRLSFQLGIKKSTDDLSKSMAFNDGERRLRQLEATVGYNDGKESIPSLADFMHRAKVRKQYRNFVRLAHFVDNTSSSAGNEGKAATGECRAALEEVRLSFQLGIKKSTDDLSKSMAFNDGERRLRQLEATVGYSRKSITSDDDEEASTKESYEADSWINIKDEEDKRGRVGVAWPWESDDGPK